MESRFHLVEAGVVINVQHTVDLREMPPETASEVGFANTLVSHTLVQDDLDGGESRKDYLAIAAWGWRRDISLVVDTGGDGLLQCVEGAGLGLCAVISKGGELREVKGGY